MSGFFGPGAPGSNPFDDFLAQFFGAGSPGQRSYSVDITWLVSHQARDLVADAANQTAE